MKTLRLAVLLLLAPLAGGCALVCLGGGGAAGYHYGVQHRKCPYCAKSIDRKATTCPYCGKAVEPVLLESEKK